MVSINGVTFKSSKFHNGETIFEGDVDILKKNEDEHNVIEMVFESNEDITNANFARKWIQEQCGDVPCDLVMAYCPYERMDRGIGAQLFSLRYFARIIGDMQFSNVYVLDPHSKVLASEFKASGVNVVEIDLEKYIQIVVSDFRPDYICYPDSGAASKYPSVLKNIDIPYFFGKKKRDLENKGKIMYTELVNAPCLTDKRVLIIDDICCLGGTAYNVAKCLKEAGAKEVAFYISHCEAGISVGSILKPNTGENKDKYGTYVINKVYTANTMGTAPLEHENVIVVNPDIDK